MRNTTELQREVRFKTNAELRSIVATPACWLGQRGLKAEAKRELRQRERVQRGLGRDD